MPYSLAPSLIIPSILRDPAETNIAYIGMARAITQNPNLPNEWAAE